MTLADDLRRVAIERIRTLDAQLKALTEERVATVVDLQAGCPHPRAWRTPMFEGLVADRSPLVMCATCKLTFSEWDFRTESLQHTRILATLPLNEFLRKAGAGWDDYGEADK